MAKGIPFKPLRHFDYKLVQERLDGLLINVDRDLQRAVRRAEAAGEHNAARQFGLLNVFVRFVSNAYHAVGFVVADTPEDAARKPNYALIIPPVNRQLLDLLFSLVYMLDDFDPRSLEYQRAGWREAFEEYQKFKTVFSTDPDWRPFFLNFKGTLDRLASIFGITKAERQNLSLIPYWKTPTELKDKKTASRAFLRWLDKWLYGDTSAQAHLSFGGLFMVSPFLMSELVGGQDQEIVQGRITQQYRYQQFSRTAIVTLAIVTEIDGYCKLGNSKQIAYLWRIFSEHVPEGREMFNERYKKPDA